MNRTKNPLCRCGEPRRPDQRTCLKCHAAAQQRQRARDQRHACPCCGAALERVRGAWKRATAPAGPFVPSVEAGARGTDIVDQTDEL